MPVQADVVVLLSIGRHPVSERPRVSAQDLGALAMAARLGLEPIAFHAGHPDAAELLATAIGLGAHGVRLIEIAGDSDPVPALSHCLEGLRPRLVLTGERAEAGEGSGCVPFIIARRLGYPVISSVAQIERGIAGRWVLTQALEGGNRRIYETDRPVVCTVGPAAPRRGLSSVSLSRSAVMDREMASVCVPDSRLFHPAMIARRPPKPILRPSVAGTDDPLDAILSSASQKAGRRLSGLSATEAAGILLEELRTAGALTANVDAPGGER